MRGEGVAIGLKRRADEVVPQWRGTTEDVALDVAAGGQGGEKDAVDSADDRFQVALQDAVRLEFLSGGDSQSSVADLARQ